MDAGTLSQNLWLQLMQSLQEKVKLPGALQLVSPSLVWNWGGKSTMPQANYAQYINLDQVPLNPVADVTTAGAANGFGETYNMLLTRIDPIPQEKDPQYEQLQQEVTDASGSYTQYVDQAKAAFSNYQSQGGTEDYTTWLANEGAGFAAQVDQARTVLSNAQQNLKQYMASLSKPINDAMNKYSAGMVSAVAPDGAMRQIPYWNTDQSPYGYVNTITRNNFGQDAVAGNPLSVSFNQDDQKYDYSSRYGQGRASFGYFIRLNVGGSYSKVDTSQFSSEYSVTYAFQDLGTVGVAPDAWYDPGLVTTYRNGPFWKGFSGFYDPNDPDGVYYFGPGGALSRQITSLVVAYRPTVTLDAGTAFASYVQSQLKAGGSLQVGPFTIGGSGGSDTEAGTVSVSGSQIRAQGTGDWPLIIGFVSEWTVAPPS